MAKKEIYKIKYVGNTPEAEVIGLGVFLHDQEVTFDETDKILIAKNLVISNANFKEVEK